jgi:hypothetical protein
MELEKHAHATTTRTNRVPQEPSRDQDTTRSVKSLPISSGQVSAYDSNDRTRHYSPILETKDEFQQLPSTSVHQRKDRYMTFPEGHEPEYAHHSGAYDDRFNRNDSSYEPPRSLVYGDDEPWCEEGETLLSDRECELEYESKYVRIYR